MAPICTRFSQNAWKKDMCSHCFRSKSEHSLPDSDGFITNLKKHLIKPTPVKGIIKTTTKSKYKKRNVSFSSEPAQVIGHGGEEWSDDEGMPDDLSSGSSEDDCMVTEEDKERDKLTKYNTDFNTNLPINNNAATNDKRRSFTQLMLGKPQTDSDGNKQTLLISVTPFGQEDKNDSNKKNNNNNKSQIPIAKNKEENKKSNIVLTSYVKNNKDSETNVKNFESNNLEILNNSNNEIKVFNMSKDDVDNRNDKNLALQINNDERNNKCELQAKIEENNAVLQEITIEDMKINSTDNYEELNNDNSDFVDSAADMSMSSSDDYETLDINTPSNDKTITSTANSELIKSRTELKIQLVTAPEEVLPKENKDLVDSSDDNESITIIPKETREQAGEPDGRADPDIVIEPPALPLTPPPPLLNPRISFLHGSPKNSVRAKPKVPSKEKVMQLFKKSVDLPPLPPIYVNTNDNKTPNKRRAPNPPPSPIIETAPAMVRCDSLPENISPECEKVDLQPLPEPAPRKNISVSHENILTEFDKTDSDKRKDKTRPKFSLKKFLRVGNNANKTSSDKKVVEKDVDSFDKSKAPQVKPRLVIVHPLDLMNGSSVEVARQEEVSVKPDVIPPAPPPRNIPPEKVAAEIKQLLPPPKSEEIIKKLQQQPANSNRSAAPGDTSYANIGEVRSAIAPSKPQRTASMREREAREEQRRRQAAAAASAAPATPTTHRDEKEHVYERIVPRRAPDDPPTERSRFKSTSLPSYSTGSESDCDHPIYSPCSFYGSECDVTDTASTDGGSEWSTSSARPCRLRCRKGRSILHKNLEDNYGAVVIANREALAQVLDNLHGCPVIPPALRGLQTLSVLRWADFSIVDSSSGVVVGKRAFYHGLWGAHHVTLALSKQQTCSVHKPALGSFTLTPVIDFSDLIPASLLQFSVNTSHSEEELVQASISVLPWMHIETIQSFGNTMKTKYVQVSSEDTEREVSSILLQLINGLKALQAQGTEEMPLSLSNFILCREVDRDVLHRLCILQGLSDDIRPNNEETLGSLCQVALSVLDELLPNHRLAALLRCLLRKESAMSLSQVKSVLEFHLWGPTDVTLGMSLKDRELALQRWLDLERATVLHGLVGARVQLSVLEECHLLFLVRSSAKMMSEAALLLESNGVS